MLIFLLFGLPLLNPAAEFYRWDTWIYQWPLLLELKSQWMSGRVPFWISQICGGTPLLANINAAALYPLRVIHYLIPLPYGYNLFVLVHWVLAFLFTFLWLFRGLQTSSRGAVLAAMVYCFSGYARGMWDTHNFTILPWVPLWLLALSLAGRPGHLRKSSLLAALAWVLMILGGDTQQLVFSGLAGGLYCLFLPACGQRLKAMTLGAVIGTLLGAPQLLPAYHASEESYRAEGLEYRDAVERSFHPLRSLDFAVPYLYGTHEKWHAPGLFGQNATRTIPWSASHHTGLISWVLAGFLIRYTKRREAWWASTLLIAAGLLSMGRFLPGFAAWHSLPMIEGFRYPEKYLFWLPVGCAVLSGLGHDAFINMRKPRPCSVPALMGMLAALVLLILLAAVTALHVGVPSPAVWLSVLLAAGSGALLVIPFRSAHPSAPLLWILLIQLLIPWYRENPLSSRLDLDEAPPLAELILQSDDPQGKFYVDPAATTVPLPSYWNRLKRDSEREYCAYASGLRFNSCRLWGLNSPDGFSPLEQMYSRNFRIQYAQSADGRHPDTVSFVHFLQTTGTRWVLTTPDRWAAFQALGLTGRSVRYWDPDGAPSILVHLDNVFETGPVPADIQRPAPGRITIDIHSDLVFPLRISESASRGWTSSSEGVTLEFAPHGHLQLNNARPGTTVELTYQAPGWPEGIQLHLLGWVLTMGIIIFPIQGRQRPNPGRSVPPSRIAFPPENET